MKSFLLISSICLSSFLGNAQRTNVTGVVTNQEGLPMKGVKVIGLGAHIDVETNDQGRYQIEVELGEDLVFKYPDHNLEKAKAYGNFPVHIKMSKLLWSDSLIAIRDRQGKSREVIRMPDANIIGQESFEENVQTDFTRILSGKTAGVQILSKSGYSGSFNHVIIRGRQTIHGDNNALYVIDGVPFSNDINEECRGNEGPHASSRSFDIDPNNILKVRILKGLAATTLYGSEGKNGVILITTKSGGLTAR